MKIISAKTKIFILVFSILVVLMPLIIFAATSSNCYIFETGVPFFAKQGECKSPSGFQNMLSSLIKKLFPIAGILAFAMIVYAGFEYATSGGDTNKQKDAQDRITNALIGLLLLFAFYLIIYTINPDILKTKVPTLEPVTLPSVSTPSTNVTLSQFIATAKSFANPDPTVEIKIFTSPDAPHEKYCQITTRTEGRTSTKTIPFQDCLNTYPSVANYWNALPNGNKNSNYSYGMSCEIYVATVIRKTIDSNLPYLLPQGEYLIDKQYTYLKNSDKFQCVQTNDPSQAKNGSILFYDLNSNNSPDHVALWINGQRLQASQGEYFPMNRGSVISNAGFPLMAICTYKGF